MSVEVLARAIRQVLGATGLPEIDHAVASPWSLVVPVSESLRDAEAMAAAAPRSARSLHTAFGLDSGQAYAAPLPERK